MARRHAKHCTQTEKNNETREKSLVFFFMQKNNENLGKTLTYGAPYVIIYT